MIIPLPLIGIALAGRMLLSKNKALPFPRKVQPLLRLRPHPMPLYRERKMASLNNPLANLMKGFSSSLSKIVQKPLKKDYDEAVRSFLPEYAELLTPSYPPHAGPIYLADLDGDSQNELVASYKLNNDTTTLVLKKEKDRWNKITEIKHPELDNINFLGFADITGDGKKQLLIGKKVEDNLGELHGYSLQNGEAIELFAEGYSRFETLEPLTTRSEGTAAGLAIWHMDDIGTYNIKVMQWNGSELEPVEDPTPYYYRKVLPYYARKVKQKPNSSINWYNLADTLHKLGMHRDALMAVESGMQQNPVLPSVNEFSTLRSKVLDALNS